MVVTDIEGYSDLIKSSPELMTKALSLHNNAINKARWQNFGYTIEQEGDSFTVVFYEALDAVIFCLQVGTAQHRHRHKHWHKHWHWHPTRDVLDVLHDFSAQPVLLNWGVIDK